MRDATITRRGFIAATAGALGAVTAAGAAGSAWDAALAANYQTSDDVELIYSSCAGCSNNCGFTAYVSEGKLGKVIGDAENPASGGKLCAIGYAYPQIVESDKRVVEPMKKNAQGTFEPISWDEAFTAIASVIGGMQPEKLAFIGNGRPTSSFYGERFMWALGSANVYSDDAARSLARKAGTYAALGFEGYTPDVAHSKMTLYLCDGALGGMYPAQLAAMQAGHENGARIVVAGPGMTGDVKFADEWLAVKPGTQLALVLALANDMLENGYDANFVAAQGVGFEEFRTAIMPYNAHWAEGITGVEANAISELAADLREAAPACSVALDRRGGNGALYGNSGELARATALLNALLGCYNQKGGALVNVAVRPGELQGITPVDAPKAERVGDRDYPLGAQVGGSAAAAIKAAHDGAISGLIFCGTDFAGDAASPEYVRSAIEGCDLSVCIDIEMSETAQACQYVLPDVSYLERDELPAFVDGPTPGVTMRNAVLAVANVATKPLQDIFCGLAKACGIGDLFDFSAEDVARAQLQSVGVSYDGAASIGSVAFHDKAVAYGELPAWNTPSGKVEFASEACKVAGVSAAPTWVEPSNMSTEGQFALVSGSLPINSGALAGSVESLALIAAKYDLSRVWLNVQDANRLHVASGDAVTLVNQTERKATVRVTDCVMPGVVFVPSGFGRSKSGDDGVNVADLVPFAIEPAYGAGMVRDAALTVQKAGA